MCYVVFIPQDAGDKFICWLHDRETAKVLGEKIEDKMKRPVGVRKIPLIEARKLGVQYWEEVIHDYQ